MVVVIETHFPLVTASSVVGAGAPESFSGFDLRCCTNPPLLEGVREGF